MLKLRVCPHDTSKNLAKWQEVAKKIAQIFNEEVDFTPFKDFTDEKRALYNLDFDIYYANPDDMYALLERGFIPIAKLPDQKDVFLIVSKKRAKERINSICISPLITHYIMLLDLDLEGKGIRYCASYKEMLKKLQQGQVDATVIYKDFFDGLEEDIKKEFFILDQNVTPFSHYFCVSKELLEKGAKKLESMIKAFELEKISEKTLDLFRIIAKLAKTYEKQYHLAQLFLALKEVNQMTIFSETEEELFEKICQNLVEVAGFEFVWIGKEQHGEILPAYHYGDDKGYIQELNITLDDSPTTSHGPTATAFKKDIIVTNSDTYTNSAMVPWREALLKRGILSSVSIPIKKGGRVYAVLNAYAKFRFVTSQEYYSLYKEIEKDISFAIDKIELIKQHKLVSAAVKRAKSWVLILDENLTIIYANDYVFQKSGYQKEEVLGKSVTLFDKITSTQHIWEKIQEKKEPFSGLFHYRKKSGEELFLDMNVVPIQEEVSHKDYFLVFGEDVTEKIQLFQEREKYKFYDHLTGLLNMYAFTFEVTKALEKKSGDLCALLILDIYNMAYINSQYGLEFGNSLLRKIAEELRKSLKKEDVFARIGGDEFGLFVCNIKDLKNITIIIQRIKDIFTILSTKELQLYFDVGISFYPNDGEEFEELYQKATLALNSAKKDGPNSVKVYTPELSNQVENLFYAEELIIKAFESGDFTFFYQPFFDATSLQMSGCESLIRVVEKDGTIHYPNEFIDFLEESKHLERFEKWAIKEVAQKIELLKVPLSVNISARGLYGTYLLPSIKALKKSVQEKLIIEITERNILEDVDRSIEVLQEIKKINPHIQIAIDDFGTGYSSLSYLKNLPVDKLKIDISFVQNMTKSKKDLAIVEIIIDLAQKLDLLTIAEGVETKEQLQLLQLLGVDFIQGYYLSKPMPLDDILKKIEDKR